MNDRFTLDGDEALEQRLRRICGTVSTEILNIVPSKDIEAVYLGGGYGRGEGGVLRTSVGDQPYNDLEFYVCLVARSLLKRERLVHAFHALGEKLSSVATIEVEFKLTSLHQLRREAQTMFFYDLAKGHKMVLGQRDALNSIETLAEQIPLYEATRLLMNRCSGLLFSQDKLRRQNFSETDADFVGRNQAKAQLGFGDVVLTALGKYHWSCRERQSRLQSLTANVPRLSQIRCHHALGVEFKLHPQKRSGSSRTFLPLQSELLEIGAELWLWLESQRLQNHFSSITDYAFSSVNKCPETRALRNLAINGIRLGPKSWYSSKLFRYPRERLLESLPVLLWRPLQAKELQLVRTRLNTSGSDFPQLVSAYTELWKRFN